MKNVAVPEWVRDLFVGNDQKIVTRILAKTESTCEKTSAAVCYANFILCWDLFSGLFL